CARLAADPDVSRGPIRAPTSPEGSVLVVRAHAVGRSDLMRPSLRLRSLQPAGGAKMQFRARCTPLETTLRSDPEQIARETAASRRPIGWLVPSRRAGRETPATSTFRRMAIGRCRTRALQNAPVPRRDVLRM